MLQQPLYRVLSNAGQMAPAEPTFLMGGGLVVDVLRRTVLVGDVNGDGEVGFADLLLVLARWGEACGDCPEDLSGNGVIDFDDVLTLLTNWT